MLDESVQRWRSFAAKIRSRADELHALGWAETRRLQAQAGSVNDNAAYLFWSGVAGQIDSLRDKLNATFDKNVVTEFECRVGTYRSSWGRYDFDGPAEALLHQLRRECFDLDAYLLDRRSANPSDAHAAEDAEHAYERILQEHERTRDRFSCRNCGAQLEVGRVFCLAIYVDCGYCQSKNTFQPSDAACGLPAVAEKLAEGRVSAWRARWETAAAAVPAWSAENSGRWHERKAEEVARYVDYINAKYDVIDGIVPELKMQNDLVRRSRIDEMRKAAPA